MRARVRERVRVRVRVRVRATGHAAPVDTIHAHGDLYQGVELRARDLLGRYREIWGDMGRYREIQGDAGLGHETCTG